MDPDNKRVNLKIATNNSTIVRAVVIFADQLFPVCVCVCVCLSLSLSFSQTSYFRCVVE